MDSSVGIGDLAAILTAAGVAIYALGLIGLAIPIRTTFTEDITTAWYAVALVPRTVVAGQGVRIWLGWPIVSVIVLIGARLLAPKVTTLLEPLPVLSRVSSLTVEALVLTAFGAAVGGLLAWQEGPEERRLASNLSGIDAALVKNLRTIAGLLGVGIQALTITPYVREDLPLFVSILLAVVGGFAIGLGPAILAVPPLPYVSIAKRSEVLTKGDARASEGHLVAHVNGFWHLFNEDSELLSIPDDQVSEARTIGKAPIPPAEDEKRTGAARRRPRRAGEMQ
jgi:hypothetical protein